MKYKILVTGGAGYIGSKLVDRLISDDCDVVVVDDLSCGKEQNINKKAKFYKMSILDNNILSVLQTEKPKIIFHLAASKDVNQSVSNPLGFAENNILGSLNIINAAYKTGIKKIIFTSTAGVYGDCKDGKSQREGDLLNPSSPYALTKLATEEYLAYMNNAHGMENVILRFANVYGPGGSSPYKSAVNIFIEKILKGEKIIIHGNGKQTRDFIYIDDLVDVCQKFKEIDIAKIKKPAIFNISTGKEISINNLIKVIAKITKINTNISYEKDIFSGQKSSLLDIENTEKQLAWKAKVVVEEGITKTFKLYESDLKNI